MYVRPKVGRTLVAGSRIYGEREDRRKRYPNALGVDMEDGLGVDLVLNLEDSLPATLGRFDHVDCLSVLEHSRRPWLLAANIERLLEPGGTLYLYVPFIWWLHRPPDYWRMTVEAVRSVFPLIVWDRLLYVPGPVNGKTPSLFEDGQRYLVRTEVCGFGVKIA